MGVTSEHPLFTVGQGWLTAGELAPGDQIRNADLRELTILAVEVDDTPTRVHNLEIADAHTYFAGELEAWGHNNTLPSLPDRNIAPGVRHTFGNCPLPGTRTEHGPPHVNITADGVTIRVGGNGKPLKDSDEKRMTKKHQRIIDCNKGKIRGAAKKIGKWFAARYK